MAAWASAARLSASLRSELISASPASSLSAAERKLPAMPSSRSAVEFICLTSAVTFGRTSSGIAAASASTLFARSR